MKKVLHIRRQKAGSNDAYWEDFIYEYKEADTVATALMTLPVVWEHSCLQKRCGACAVVINGIPRLAYRGFRASSHRGVLRLRLFLC